ncbi:hypothetical protein ACHAWF_001652 [Thalassiosira exigua]
MEAAEPTTLPDGNEMESPTGAGDEESSRQKSDKHSEHDGDAQAEKWESDEGRNLGFWDIFVVQSTYSTAGCVVFTPYIFGQWGYVLGPMLFALWMLLMYGMACFVSNVMQQSHNNIKHHGDAGFELSGYWGRAMFNLFLMLNMIFYLPVAIETVAISLQTIANYPFNDGKGCVGYWKIITAALLFCLLQIVKKWKSVAWISYVSVTLLAIKSFALIPWGLVIGQETYKTSSINLGPAKPFLSPEPTWTGLIGGLYVYTSYAVMILAETVPHANNPKEYNKAMGLAHIFMYFLYCVPGWCSAFLWGWNVPFLINTGFVSNPALSTVLNIIIAGLVSLDFIIAAIIVNDAFRRAFISPGAAGPNWWQHLKCTLPSSLFALLLCIAVPNMEVITGLVSTIGGTPTLTFVISFAWLCGGRGFKSSKWMHAISIGWGIPTFLAQLVYSVYSIAITNYSIKDFFCLGE